MWSLLRNLVDGEDTRTEYASRTELHRIRQLERRGVMDLVEKAESIMEVGERLEDAVGNLLVAAEEAKEGETTTLRKMFGDTQVEALVKTYEDDKA